MKSSLPEAVGAPDWSWPSPLFHFSHNALNHAAVEDEARVRLEALAQWERCVHTKCIDKRPRKLAADISFPPTTCQNNDKSVLEQNQSYS
jgi:hypothetical protein